MIKYNSQEAYYYGKRKETGTQSTNDRRKKKLFIHNYKAYRETFKFSYFSSPEDITENTNYKVYPFSREIIDAIGLRLYPPRWSFISPDSDWEYRAPRTRSQQDFGKFNSYYDKALCILNFLRTTPNNKNEENSRLEMRVSRFERLCELGAPKERIAKEISLIINIVEELELELFPKNSQRPYSIHLITLG